MTDRTALVHRYFDLAPSPDVDAYFGQFAEDAVVEDEGRERHGLDEIRTWRREVTPVSYDVREVRSAPAGVDARVEVSGDFPGSPVGLSFHFEFAADGLITALTIRT